MREPALLAGAAIAYAILAGAVWTAVYEPLPNTVSWLGPATWLAGSAGVGLVFRRYRSIALAALIPLTAAVVSGDPLQEWLAAFGAVGLGAVIAVMVLVGRRTGRAAPVAGLALIVFSLAPLAWAGYRQWRPLDVTPSHPLGIDLLHQSFRGVGVGDPASRIQPRLGRAIVGRPGSSVNSMLPVGASYDVNGDPPPLLANISVVYRYPGVAYLVVHGRVVAIVITDPNAQTSAGVGPGDNIAIARARYPGLACGFDSSAEPRGLPNCAGRLDGHPIWISEDPIGNITLTSERVN